MSRAAVFIAIVVCGLGGCAAPSAVLPSEYLGLWAATAGACLDPDATDRMDVAADRLQFYEWGGDVVSIREKTARNVRFDADWSDVSDTDENERPIVRRKIVELRFPGDRSLLALTVDNERSDYIRCQGTTT